VFAATISRVFCSRIADRKSRFTLAKNYEPRIWKAWAVMVVAACAAIDGQSSPRQTSDALESLSDARA
jgi:hypothetical protein